MKDPYYVYALKDPRSNPAKIFYIGKGTGTRAGQHLKAPDETRKGRLIQEILDAGHDVLVTILVDDLAEAEALKIEAELISALGVEETGGLLSNSVFPAGSVPGAGRDKKVVVPSGAVEKAQVGLAMLKDAVLELARANPNGITNAATARKLGLQSHYGGGAKDYLSYSILGLLMADGKLERREGSKKHFARAL